MQIAQAMLTHYAKEDRKVLKQFAPDARAALLAYSWPGNVRELINLIRAIAALYDGEELSMEMLPLAIKRKQAVHVDRLEAQEEPEGAAFLGSDIRTLAEIERRAIERALHVFNGNITQAAKALGVNVSTIYRKKNIGR
jgi:two-component system repressor protein LuxO